MQVTDCFGLYFRVRPKYNSNVIVFMSRNGNSLGFLKDGRVLLHFEVISSLLFEYVLKLKPYLLNDSIVTSSTLMGLCRLGMS